MNEYKLVMKEDSTYLPKLYVYEGTKDIIEREAVRIVLAHAIFDSYMYIVRSYIDGMSREDIIDNIEFPPQDEIEITSNKSSKTFKNIDLNNLDIKSKFISYREFLNFIFDISISFYVNTEIFYPNRSNIEKYLSSYTVTTRQNDRFFNLLFIDNS